MGFFSNIAKGLGLGGPSNTGARSAEQIGLANAEARKELERTFGVSEDKFTDAQKQLRDDFLRQRGLLDPFVQAGTRALGDVEQAGTVGGLDARINEILGSESFQGLKAERIRDQQTQLAAGGLTRSGTGLEQIAGISPELAFQIEQQQFGRQENLANLGFRGIEAGNQLTLGQGQLSTGLTGLEENLRSQFGGRVSDLIGETGRARSSGVLADQQIDQQSIQNLLNLAGLGTEVASTNLRGRELTERRRARVSTGRRNF